MPNVNKANREVCDVEINFLSTKKPFLHFDTANTTTAGISGDAVHAMAKGSRRIPFYNPIEGTMTIEAQVYPFKLFALFSDGTITSGSGAYAVHKKITCAAAGVLSLSPAANETISTGTVFAYPAGHYGEDSYLIVGTYASGTITATSAGDIIVGNEYEVGYLVTNSAAKRIVFNNSHLPADYIITMSTVDKDEEGNLVPFFMKAYKANIQRNFELSFSSEGDPASVTLTFDLLEDADGNVMDMFEIDGESMTLGRSLVGIVKGASSPDIAINGASGAVTVAIKDSSEAAYTKLHAVISGDRDNMIITADSDADVGTYTVTLTDAASNTATVTVVVSAAT